MFMNRFSIGFLSNSLIVTAFLVFAVPAGAADGGMEGLAGFISGLMTATLAGVIGGLIKPLFDFGLAIRTERMRDEERKRIRAHDCLEKLYIPLRAYLNLNDHLWKEFRAELHTAAHLTPDDTKLDGIATISSLLEGSPDREKELVLSKWVGGMESVFRSNNESAEMLILNNLSFLRPEDADPVSNFSKQFLDYLLHTAEFKSILNRWEKQRYALTTWLALSKTWTEQHYPNQQNERAWEKERWRYFHPSKSYPTMLIAHVDASIEKLKRDCS